MQTFSGYYKTHSYRTHNKPDTKAHQGNRKKQQIFNMIKSKTKYVYSINNQNNSNLAFNVLYQIKIFQELFKNNVDFII